MPQISKLRIVNFQYNSGNRLIADELFDFESEESVPSDVLINLENGGGKSVLVQLMLQPVIPRARVGGRKIEGNFTKSTDHCYVVLEWKLDGSRMKLMTGIAMAASDASNDPDSERGFQIKYYTFLSSYQNESGLYNIVNLPLSRRENGRFLPAAFDEVRNLAKKSNGALERYSSDDSLKWKERLSQYGISQEEWRTIEELNSSEQGVTEYFKNLKNSDAVIDRLVIPRIEEKQSHSGSKDDSSLETMLISYAKQFSRQQDIIKERDLCAGFCSMLETAKTEAEALWTSSDSLEKCIGRLFAYTDALEREIKSKEERAGQLNENQKEQERQISRIQWEKASADYYVCRESFERESEKYQAAEEERKNKDGALTAAKKKQRLIRCADWFAVLKELEGRIAGISEEIRSRENDSESAERLAVLKYSALLAIRIELQKALPIREQLSDEEEMLKAAAEETEKKLEVLQAEVEAARNELTRAETILSKQRQDDDRSVEELGVEAYRMFDGAYPEADLRKWQKSVVQQAERIRSKLAANEKQLQKLEARRDMIPQEIANEKDRTKGLRSRKDEIGRQIEVYRESEKKIRSLCEKHALDFGLRFTDHIRQFLAERISAEEASVLDELRRIETAEEAVAAAERGTLHIPKLLTDYLDSTGIRYISFEKYLLEQQSRGLLSQEACQLLLSGYPYAAYGIIMEDSDIQTLLQEENSRWLPSVLPLFTMTEVGRMLEHEAYSFSALAAFSKEYFLDSASYADDRKAALEQMRERKAQLEERIRNLRSDLEAAEAFAGYDEKWSTRAETEAAELTREIEASQTLLAKAEEEKQSIRRGMDEARKKDKQLNSEHEILIRKLSDFDKLLERFREEAALDLALQTAEKKHRELSAQKREAQELRDQQTERRITVLERLREQNAHCEALERGLESVRGAAETEALEGEWDHLLNQYGSLLEAQNADLKRLGEERIGLQTKRKEQQEKLQNSGCSREEYEHIHYTAESESRADSEVQRSEKEYREAEERCRTAGRKAANAETACQEAAGKLHEFGDEPLPANEVGRLFDFRIAEAKMKLTEMQEEEKTLSAELGRLRYMSGRAEAAAGPYSRPVKYDRMTLGEDCGVQLDALTKQIREGERSVRSGENQVRESLKKMAEEYAAKSADIQYAVLNMQKLLSDSSVQGDRYYTLCEHIDSNLNTTRKRISQIDTDLTEINKTKGDLTRHCVIQGKQIFEGLLQLSSNSKVRVQGKRREMLRFDIPDAVDENAASAAIAAEIEKGTLEITAKMEEDTYAESDIRKIAARTVGSQRLLRKYIGAENIVLKAYKIDRNPEHSGYRTWETTQVNNSGAEKFVVYLAMILALMAYSRDDCGGLDDRNNRSVLVLDNPFGPISSKHVLEPMFEISRNYHVQMICLSNISNSDVVSCFRLVIQAVVRRFAFSSKEQLTHDGNEAIEHGFYRAEQMNLF